MLGDAKLRILARIDAVPAKPAMLARRLRLPQSV
jgi:hypothetical protein